MGKGPNGKTLLLATLLSFTVLLAMEAGAFIATYNGSTAAAETINNTSEEDATPSNGEGSLSADEVQLPKELDKKTINTADGALELWHDGDRIQISMPENTSSALVDNTARGLEDKFGSGSVERNGKDIALKSDASLDSVADKVLSTLAYVPLNDGYKILSFAKDDMDDPSNPEQSIDEPVVEEKVIPEGFIPLAYAKEYRPLSDLLKKQSSTDGVKQEEIANASAQRTEKEEPTAIVENKNVEPEAALIVVPAAPAIQEVEEKPVAQPKDEKTITEAPSKEALAPVETEKAAVEDDKELSAVESDWKELLTLEDDFFADFYIAGEDELEFVDGEYYMDLYIDDEKKGDITVNVVSRNASISTAELKSYVSDDLTAEAYDRIFMGAGAWLGEDDLISKGVNAQFDIDSYAIYLKFDVSDMPIKVISVSSRSSRSGSAERTLSGAETLVPAVFTHKATYTGNLSWTLSNREKWDWNLYMYSSNLASLYDTFLSYNYTVRYNGKDASISLGSYTFYRDWTDKMLRLSWGNVSSGILSPSGQAVGIRLEKSTLYADGRYVRKNPYDATITVEKESKVEVINGTSTIYERTLSPGIYRLEDFVLFSGVNRVLVRITPLDGSEVKEIIKEFSYYSDLLYPGENYWSLALTTGRESLSSESAKRDGAVGFNLGKQYLQYDARNLVASASLNIGITDNATFKGALSVANTPTKDYELNLKSKLNMELTQKSFLGTTKYNLNLDEHRLSDGDYSWPSVYARIGHQTSTGWKLLSNFNVGVSYTSPESVAKTDARHIFGINAGISGRLGILSYSLGGNAYLYTDDSKDSYNAYLSLSTYLRRRVSLSGTMNMSGTFGDSPKISGTVYISYAFSHGSVSSTITDSSTRNTLNLSMPVGTLNMSVNTPSVSTWRNFDKLSAYSFNGSYSATGKLFGFGTSVGGDMEADRLYGTVSVNTSTLFADGYFSLSSTLPSSAVLIRQKGILRGNKVSAGYSGSSSFLKLGSFLGTSVYSGLSSSRYTNFMLYSEGKGSFTSPASVSLSVPPSKNKIYKYRFTADAIFTISGIATIDGEKVWANGSSPLYKATITDDGSVELEIDDSGYVFTDESGRFIISDLANGLYAFDIPTENGWTLALIDVKGSDKEVAMMCIYTENGAMDGITIPEQYSDSVHFSFVEAMDSDSFWAMIYPDAFGGIE